LSIGDVLSLLKDEFPDITISKIRFLESQGLLDPERTPSGYRKFYEEDVDRLRWILRQQRENFLPLKVIKGRLGGNGDTTEGPSPDPERPEASTAGAGAGVGVGRTATGSRSAGAGAMASAVRHRGAGRPDRQAQESGEREPSAREPTAQTSTLSPVPASTGSRSRFGVPSQPRGAGSRPAEAPPAHARGRGGSPSPSAPSTPDPSGRPDATASPSGRPPDATGPGGRRDEPAGPAGRSEDTAPTAGRPDDTTPTAGRPADSAGARSRRAEAPNRRPAPPEATAEEEGGGPLSIGLSGVNLTAEELAEASGLSGEELRELERYGLLVGRPVGDTIYFDEESLTVARLAAGFRRFGIEARHLRMYRTAADREASFFEQIVMPMLKQRNPVARRRAVETLAELARLGQGLRGSLLRSALKDNTGG
jgi:DNA-binding transcriptional MerR regulator